MRLSLVTAPAVEPVTTDQVKAHLRLGSSSSEDDVLDLFIRAARERAEAETGRTLIQTDFDLFLDGWAPRLALPRPPAVSVTSITYSDDAGASQTWAAENYQTSIPAGPFAEPAIVTPAYDVTFPTLEAGKLEPVVVRYRAGYGAAGTDVPMPIRMAILLMVGHWYEHREDVETMPTSAARLLRPYWWRPTGAC
jgi:uncharacterized phiE125 gp8 family phage protein